MSPAWLCILVVILSSLNLHNAAAQSQMCEEPFQAVLTLVNNVTFPRSTNFLDSDLVYYRKILHITEEEIDPERELGMRLEGKLAFAMQRLVYRHDYIYDVCKQQGIIFQLESLAPLRGVPVDRYIVRTFQVRSRMLGEGTTWGVSRISVVNSRTLRYEVCQVYSFL